MLVVKPIGHPVKGLSIRFDKYEGAPVRVKPTFEPITVVLQMGSFVSGRFSGIVSYPSIMVGTPLTLQKQLRTVSSLE